jgi:hypothetical protein
MVMPTLVATTWLPAINQSFRIGGFVQTGVRNEANQHGGDDGDGGRRALAGCATPEQRVRSGLIEAGLSQPIATCMAARMVDRLSLLQLRRIGRLGDLRDANVSQLTVEQFLNRSRALGDPEILAVMSTSAALCAIRR